MEAIEDVCTEWIDSYKNMEFPFLVIYQISFLIDMGDVLNWFLEVWHWNIAFHNDGMCGLAQRKHLQALCVISLLVSQEIFLAEDKLLIKELFSMLNLSASLKNILLFKTERLGEDRMIPDIISLRHLNLIRFDLLKLLFHDIITLQLEPFFVSYVEKHLVSEMKGTNVICSVSSIHHTFVNLELLNKSSVFSVVIELDGLYEILLLTTWIIIGILFIGLDDWHISLLSLNDIHRKISQVVLVVLSLQETLDKDCFLVVTIWILCTIIVVRMFEIRFTRVLNDVRIFHVLFQSRYFDAFHGIFRCFDLAWNHILQI